MTFEQIVTRALDSAAAACRAAHKYADANDIENAKSMLIDDPVSAALDEIELAEGCDKRVDEWLAKWLDKQILAMPDAVLVNYCDGLLTDPHTVEEYMSRENVAKLAASVLTKEELLAIAGKDY